MNNKMNNILPERNRKEQNRQEYKPVFQALTRTFQKGVEQVPPFS